MMALPLAYVKDCPNLAPLGSDEKRLGRSSSLMTPGGQLRQTETVERIASWRTTGDGLLSNLWKMACIV